tara:strand:- start:474 stop:1865 length:1392 start_codon:yes stop_codon:yes gene_type:complete
MIFKLKKIFILLFILLISCSKEIDISEFKNDFQNYQSELRIEALILPAENTAIVRIDKSVLINDREIYNCIDDDGDWDANYDDIGIDGAIGDPTDEDQDCDPGAEKDDPCRTEASEGEGNGVPDCNEPHVDEDDEIITQLHVNDCMVSIKNGDSNCNFKYTELAGSFFYDLNLYKDSEDESLNNIEESFYSAYIPDENCANFNWADYEGEYEFECNCGEYGKIVSKEAIKITPPVVFFNESDIDTLETFLEIADNCLDTDCLKQSNINTLWNDTDNQYEKRYFARYAADDYIYYSSLIPYIYFQSVQYLYDDDSDRWLYFHGHPDAASDACDACGLHNNITTMTEAVVTDILRFEGSQSVVNKYYYSMFTFSESYRDYYFYDQLDLLDPKRTNLRKLNDNNEPAGMVMGAFGSMTSEKIFFDIIDCEDFGTQEDCENEVNTKSVCRWYGNIDLCLPKKLPTLN